VLLFRALQCPDPPRRGAAPQHRSTATLCGLSWLIAAAVNEFAPTGSSGILRTVSTISIDKWWQSIESLSEVLDQESVQYETPPHVRIGCRKEHVPHSQARTETKVTINV
jgi:hypothetical protein